MEFPDDIVSSRGKNILLYEVNPELKAKFPAQPDKHDSNNGIDN